MFLQLTGYKEWEPKIYVNMRQVLYMQRDRYSENKTNLILGETIVSVLESPEEIVFIEKNMQ